MMRPAAATLLLLLCMPCMAEQPEANYEFSNVSFSECEEWKAETAPTARLVYGDDSDLQFGDLRLPDTSPPPGGYPVIIFVHGGGWRAKWSKSYTEPFVEALTRQGMATWDLEYRRMGQLGGGFPGTFEDVADGADFLRTIAETHPVNLNRVVAIGHSSGGHLALWLAGRSRLPESSALHRSDPLLLQGVISLAGVNDLELSYTLGDRKDVLELMGEETMASAEPRLALTNPARLLPLGVTQVLMIGDMDSDWRLEMTDRYAQSAVAAGDPVEVKGIPGANHMDLVDARSGLATTVANVARRLAGKADSD